MRALGPTITGGHILPPGHPARTPAGRRRRQAVPVANGSIELSLRSVVDYELVVID
jgi:hypothetical protein